MIKKHTLFLVLIPILFSCRYARVPQYLKTNFTSLCYSSQDIEGIEKLKLKGYYIEENIGTKALKGKLYFSNAKDKNTTYTNLIFFENGLCAFGFHNYRDSISDLFEVIKKSNKKHPFYIGPSSMQWGIYNIVNDTIKLKAINRPSLLASTWMAFEEWYKITDTNTIQLIAHRRLNIDVSNEGRGYIPPFEIIDSTIVLPSRIILENNIPNAKYCWLLQKEWFWCDKDEFKKFRKSFR